MTTPLNGAVPGGTTVRKSVSFAPVKMAPVLLTLMTGTSGWPEPGAPIAATLVPSGRPAALTPVCPAPVCRVMPPLAVTSPAVLTGCPLTVMGLLVKVPLTIGFASVIGSPFIFVGVIFAVISGSPIKDAPALPISNAGAWTPMALAV